MHLFVNKNSKNNCANINPLFLLKLTQSYFSAQSTKMVKKKNTKDKDAKKNSYRFESYIYKVLKQVHHDTGISKKAMFVMNDFVLDIFKRLVDEAISLLRDHTHKNSLTSREIQTAVRLILPGELAKHGVSEGTKAVTKYSSYLSGNHEEQQPTEPVVPVVTGKKGKKQKKPFASRSTRAGLQFPVGRIHRLMKERGTGYRIGAGAPVYLAAVLEYLTAEVLELAGNASRDNKRIRIIPRHIQLALRNDEELYKLCIYSIVASGGVIPHIHAALFPPRSHLEGKNISHEF